jgi:4-hydroxy-tetrahydrodipicolinate reductase
MSPPIRLAINGAAGRMGRQLLDLLHTDERFEVAAAIVAADAPEAGKAVHGAEGPLRFGAEWPRERVDVVVDFSGPTGLASALDYCEAAGVALVSGTTGIEPALHSRLAKASRRIALMHESNFSLGVAVLTRLLREAAAALPQWDLEIVEAHHRRKQDAPSGTALSLGEAAAAARGTTLAQVVVQGDRKGTRTAGSIGFAVVRGGDIVGEHTALLIGQGERIELGHRAADRSIFARGAIEAAHWLSGRAPGAYALHDLLAARGG